MVRRLAYRRAALAAVAATAPGDEDRRRGGNAAGLAGRLAMARTGLATSGAGHLVPIARDGCGRAYGRHARSAGARWPLSRARACGRRRAAPARRRAADRRAQALSGRIPARRARYRRPARLERDRLHLRSHHERQRHARLTSAAHRSPAWGKLALFVVALVALAAAWRYTPLAEVARPPGPPPPSPSSPAGSAFSNGPASRARRAGRRSRLRPRTFPPLSSCFRA